MCHVDLRDDIDECARESERAAEEAELKDRLHGN